MLLMCRLNQSSEQMEKMEVDLHAERVKFVKENETLKADLAKTEAWLAVGIRLGDALKPC